MEKYKWIIALTVVALLTTMFSVTTLAPNTRNVTDTMEGTWKAASSQIETAVNNVVFPAIGLVLVVLFFVKVVTAYTDYRKHDQIEWAPTAILFIGLVFSLFAPMYVWQIVGI